MIDEDKDVLICDKCKKEIGGLDNLDHFELTTPIDETGFLFCCLTCLLEFLAFKYWDKRLNLCKSV